MLLHSPAQKVGLGFRVLLLLSVTLKSLLHGRAGDRRVQVSRLQKGCGRDPATNGITGSAPQK